MPRRVWLCVLAALAAFAAAIAISNATRPRERERALQSDEPEWIAISILHWRQLALGEGPAGAELDPPERAGDGPWKRGVQRTTFGYMNPCLPKVVWGAALAAAGHREASPLAFQVFQRGDALAGQGARDALLPAAPVARAIVVALSAACAVLVAFAARALVAPERGEVAGWAAAALAYALWLASPLVRNTSGYIRTDYFMLPFCLTALVVVLARPDVAGGARGARAQRLAGLALGLLAGLAVSSKLNGTLVCAAIAAWLPLAWACAPREARPSFAAGPLAALAIAGVACCALFYALNPRLWLDPIGGAADVLARWQKLIASFQDNLAPRTGVEVARTLPERASLFVRKFFARDDPLAALARFPIGGLAAAAGAGWLALRARRGDGASRARAGIALAFCAIFVAGTIAWLPLDWERFYLTALPCVVLLESVALAALASRVIARSKRPATPSR
jgi:hypothetical protein